MNNNILILFCLLFLTGCFRGSKFEEPPIHLNPNMDNQPKYRSLEESYFFEDGSTMRTPIEGTVAVGHYNEDSSFLTGKNDDETYLINNPLELTMETLDRGEDRYNIYCAPCHSKVGDGKGIITQYDYIVIPGNFHNERIRNLPDGEIFHTITNGLRNMPAYGYQLKPEDAWAVVYYIRALQRSQNASLNDFPAEEKNKILEEE